MKMKRGSILIGFAVGITLAFGITLAGARAAESSGGLALGSKVPAAVAKTKMKNVDGKMLSIAEVAGKSGTLVIFTCNHCPFAKDWEQRIVELANTYAGKGIGVMLVNANDPATHAEDGFPQMQARAKERGMKIPYVVDDTSGVARAFGASVTPEAFLFDKAGKLAYHGTIDDNRKEPDKVKARYLKDALEAVVAGKAPALPETKGLGCGIKFRG
jgi:thiol-disulfide isomerase/thioredoxin